MDKAYKKFYEVGNNAYYSLVADDDNFIATETFIKVGTTKISKKPITITQGLKLLKLSIPLVVLFSKILELKVTGSMQDIPTYEKLTSKEITELIKYYYKASTESAINDVEVWYNDKLEEIKEMTNKTDEERKSLKRIYKERKDLEIQKLKAKSVTGIEIRKPNYGLMPVIDKMLDNKINFLYSEDITGFVTEHYLYEFDVFGTLTIYRVTTVKNVIKSIDTFIYNIDVINEYMNFLEKEGK